MSDVMEIELRESAQRLREAIDAVPIEVPSAVADVAGRGPAARGRTKGRRSRAAWLAVAAAVLVGVLAVSVLIAEDDTVTAGDPNLAPAEVVRGLVDALEARDGPLAVSWFAEGAEVGSIFEPTREQVVTPLEDLLAHDLSLELLELSLEMDDFQVETVECVELPTAGETTRATCVLTLRTSLSELTAWDEVWEMDWEVTVREGRITLLTSLAHADEIELQGLEAFREWVDRDRPRLTEADWLDLVENQQDELIDIERAARTDYRAELDAQQRRAEPIADDVCSDIASGGDPSNRLALGLAQLKSLGEHVAPIALLRAIDARCPGTAADLF